MYIFKCNNHIYIYNQSKVKWMNLNWGEILKIFAKKWDFFRNEPTPSFSETPAFKTKLSWNPPKGEPCLEVYLRQVEKELFELEDPHLGYSNFTRKEWTAIRSLVDDRSIIIKKVYKGSCVVFGTEITIYLRKKNKWRIKIYTRTLTLVIEFYGIR